MDHYTYWQRLEYILELIEHGRLSSPKDLVDKFDCTEKTIRKMINDLRKKGHKIKYSRSESRYVISK